MSMKILEYFDYELKKSILHHLDPRGKMLFIIVVTCITILFKEIVPLLIILGIITPLVLLGDFLRKWLRTLLILLPLLIIIVVLDALLIKVDYPTSFAIVIVLRLIVLTAIFGLYFQTVSPDDISQMLRKFGVPYSFAWAVSTAYRFIPTLAKETETIFAAQKSRGLQIDRGNIFKRARKMLPLLVPIFASAMRRSWQLAEAIESRGWNAIKKRTYLYSLKLKWWDYILILVSLALFALFLLQAIKQYPYPSWVTWHIPEKYELRRLLGIAWNWFKGLFQK
ncbi:MAG: energy-coupling factor transporter transmembrane protein EcfT [Candidatus Heimdallarchaeota archaeon]|nr:energy-coupling factor transporter transmembrane protein EcfT [Candidatus Heimdallarchaeota archaeon]MBY8993668.1 energy-coupling factor transporter transmembrane protein EcfT [Candidatus Heimdallarchaeota archaeon]